MTARQNSVPLVSLVDRVAALNEEVKELALNLAIYLGKVKGTSKQLTRLEPDFIRLVNGTVKVVQQVTHIINAARNIEQSGDDTPGRSVVAQQVDARLQSILDQCSGILNSLGTARRLNAE